MSAAAALALEPEAATFLCRPQADPAPPMFLSIKYKILLALCITTVAVVGGMWLMVKWSFDRGFLRYISSVEQESRAGLVQSLADEYRREGGWKELIASPRRWHELQVESALRAGESRRSSGFPVGTPDHFVRAPLPTPFGQPPPPHRGVRFMWHRRFPPAVLLDENRQPLIGRAGEDEIVDYSPVDVDGRTVGYLGFRPRPPLPHAQELQFSKRQAHAFMAIAVVMMVISALVALPLAGRLVKPVRELSVATRRLASGNYDTRIPVGGNDELGRLSRDFNSLAKTLEDNERSRRQWIADISHELRTPLAVLQGEIEAMQDGIRECTPARLQSLHLQTASLARLVNDLYELSLSDIGALSYQKQPVELDALLTECVETWREKFAARSIVVRLTTATQRPCAVFGDPNRLRQLLFNLLENSLRYTDPGGVVEIRLDSAAGRVQIDVQDSAPGVSEAHLPRLFERLYRVENSRSRATGGTGLGLAICRSIVDAHEGRIEARASALGGLWIRVELPMEN
ncbi:MAG: HAMP domain-containing protein [Gammaproteobacteria bacterium]|nr:HAMP domain-containing protein [Gammaproteobacteria bacterium]